MWTHAHTHALFQTCANIIDKYGGVVPIVVVERRKTIKLINKKTLKTHMIPAHLGSFVNHK